jgi:hypothetical protein
MKKIGRIPLFLILLLIVLDGNAFSDTVKFGDRIKVITVDSTVIWGRLLGSNPDSIAIEASESGIMHLDKDEISGLFVPKRGREWPMRNGLGIGLIWGAIIGIIVEWPSYRNGYDIDPWIVAACSAGGATIGVTIACLYQSEVPIDKEELFAGKKRGYDEIWKCNRTFGIKLSLRL